ncbi:MAG TPA: hypothetical protein VLN90_02875 [Thioalkalivibrio sp.]|nr:hypothetical protein [Thioalkalivibrio sp.]
MLGLARLFLSITMILALLGLTGLAEVSTGLMQMLSLIFGLFFLLALLFSRTTE